MKTLSRRECKNLSLQETLERVRTISGALPVPLPEGGVPYKLLLAGPVFEGEPSRSYTRKERRP